MGDRGDRYFCETADLERWHEKMGDRFFFRNSGGARFLANRWSYLKGDRGDRCWKGTARGDRF